MGQKLLKSTSMVALMTMLSRILGFVRDVVFASMFGAGPIFDAFVVAFKIPNFFRRLFGEGAFAQAFVPDHGENQAQTTTPQTALQFQQSTPGTRLLNPGCLRHVQ